MIPVPAPHPRRSGRSRRPPAPSRPAAPSWSAPDATPGFTISRSGTSDEPIVIRAASGRPVIDGALDGRVDVIKVNGAHDIRIEGLEVTGAQGGNYTGAGIRTENGASRIVIVDNVIRENRSYGINSHSSTNVTIRGNDIHHNAQAVQVTGRGDGTRILDNDIHENVYMVRNTPKSENAHDDTGAVGIGFVKSTGAVLATATASGATGLPRTTTSGTGPRSRSTARAT